MRKILLSVAAVLLCCATTWASNLKVVYLSGDEAMVELAKIQRIDLTNKEGFSVVGTDGNVLNSASFDESKKIVFHSTSTNAKTIENAHISVYPNPTQDALFVSGAENGSLVQVFDIKGKIIFQAKTGADNTEIPVAGYNNGTYLLKVGTQVVKFIKE